MTTALFLPHGATSAILRLQCQSSVGAFVAAAGFVGLTYPTAGLLLSTIADTESVPVVYSAAAGTIEAVSVLGTYAAPTAGKCRLKEVDAVNHPGLYEVHLADARFAVANAKRLNICVSGVENMAQANFTVWLDVSVAAAAADAEDVKLRLKRIAGRVQWIQTRLTAPPSPPKAAGKTS